ncbi:hypothetical protein GK1845 [Geobacillus kaustophilus HTA426]|uniref:SpoVT-AbrB domain-containing protein n=1 Tax=Geobacillus kaustophilus (strain HTA426) TaxID=235909 RepID=Q5KYV6_GEOKA|nr:hypothetical protein GK1845 [Geobacillus kaustophilus HTA426]
MKDKKPFFIIPYCFSEDYCYNCLYSNNFMDKNVLFVHINGKEMKKKWTRKCWEARMTKRIHARISQVGNSLSVSIPKDLATMLNLNKGDEIEIYYDKERGEIVMKRANRIPKGVRPEVVMAMNRAISKYDEALRNLKYR